MNLQRKRFTYGFAAAALVVGALAVAPAAQAAADVSPSYSSTVCDLVLYKNSDIPSSTWIPNHQLTEGDTGDYCVKLLQRGIDDLYGDASEGVPLTVDGNFGPQTYSWVRTFQSDYPCSQGVDGQAGPNTNSCLQYRTGTYDPT